MEIFLEWLLDTLFFVGTPLVFVSIQYILLKMIKYGTKKLRHDFWEIVFKDRATVAHIFLYQIVPPIIFLGLTNLYSNWTCQSSRTHSACDGAFLLVVGSIGGIFTILLGTSLFIYHKKIPKLAFLSVIFAAGFLSFLWANVCLHLKKLN